ncbi:hypothetical protein C2S53_007030 [Perilla frutescens var. hirtella]|uniref:hAT-like transposase RNase-H fold domain-containing protein n=1 Tax=Perilla frutescens var. hirtella TaxID=608512 RepID=A0AAD4J1V2_PERFH|nr:hypothetical protein C2S53_007030 [Perilla frutescens var. hirtella]
MAVDGNMQLQNHNFDPELARLNIAYMIIMHQYPLWMVEHKWFKVFLSSLQPLFKLISRNTLRADIMKIFVEEKKNIMSVLENYKSRIAITSDMWTSGNQKKGYMAITAHFIDNSWKLQSRVVRFAYVSCLHTTKVIVDVLFECLLDWNIDHEWHESEYVVIKLMDANMIAKFKKYWEDIHTIFSIALILDPRFKFRTIDYYFDKIYKDQAEFEKDKVHTVMPEIENEYKASFPKPKGDLQPPPLQYSAQMSRWCLKLELGQARVHPRTTESPVAQN